MGNRLSARQSSSKRRAATSAVARGSLCTSVSTAASTATSTAASTTANDQKVASRASASAPSGPRRVVAPPSLSSATLSLANAPHSMVAGSMPTTAAATTTAMPAPRAPAGAADAADSERRIRRAECVLRAVADEYAAKRAAGLVPTRPVPARTLLWEEMAQQQRPRTGRRGQCVFGRDAGPGALCGCSTYRRMDLPSNTGGICECCGHGGPWHRLTGGSMWSGTGSSSLRVPPRSRGTNSSLLSSTRSGGRRSRAGSSARSRPLGELLTSSARSRVAVNERGEVTAEYYSGDYGSEYDDEYDDEYDSEYDSEYDDEDDDEDEEDIANEVARPYEAGLFAGAPPLLRPLGPGAGRRVRAESGGSSTSSSCVDRSSLVSNSSNLGLPPRLSSTSRHLDRLLGAIATYRAMGLGEDEIEARIREDFPPTDRLSSAALSPRWAD